MTTCLHCGPTHRALAGRGLCWACNERPGIRRLYPRLPYPKRKAVARSASYGREPSEAELERVIAEQRACLPSSRESEERKQGRGTVPPADGPETEGDE